MSTRKMLMAAMAAGVIGVRGFAHGQTLVDDNMDSYATDNTVPTDPAISDWTTYKDFSAGPWSFNVGGQPSGTAARGSEWGASNNGIVYDASKVTGSTYADGIAIGVYAGATGDTKEMTYTYTVTSGDVSAIAGVGGGGYVAYNYETVGASIGADGRAVRQQGRFRVNGSTLETATSSYFASGSAFGANPGDEVDMGLRAATVARYTTAVATEANGSVATLGSALVAGDTLAINFRIPQNDDGAVPGGNAKNIGLAVDNLQVFGVAAGDQNADGEVTTLEAFGTINNIGGSFDYTGGDGDGDGVVGTLDAFSAANNIGSYAASAGAVSDGVASLVYDPSTGSLTLEEDGTGIKSIFLTAGPGAYDPAQAVIPAGALSLQNDATTLSWASLLANIAFDGDVIGGAGYLGTGLDIADFAGTQFLYGVDGVIGNQTGDIIVIPEPASLALLGLGGLCLLGRRKRAA